MPRCLIYRPNDKHAAAVELGERGALFRNSKYWNGDGDVEWAEARWGQEPKPFEVVYVFPDANAEAIIEGYQKTGAAKKVVRVGGEKLEEVQPKKVIPEWPLGMTPEVYLRRFPNGPKAELARSIVDG